VESWNLNTRWLKLLSRSKDFNSSLQHNTSAQLWLHIFYFSQEYWCPKILFAIDISVGSPICTDVVTSKPIFDRTLGHFVRVLLIFT